MTTTRATIPWILASLPLACVAYLFAEICEAVLHFGHFPRYLVDPDPFHTSYQSLFPDHAALIYFPLPFLLLFLLPLLVLPKFRYSGPHNVQFYTLVALSVVAMWLFVFQDIAGYIRWSLD